MLELVKNEEESKTELLKTYAIELNALTECPLWSGHKRSKNWLAVIEKDPASPGGLDRKFCRRAGGEYFYMIDNLKVNDVIECASDYYSGSGKKHVDRNYYIVKEITEDKLTLQQFTTAPQAFKYKKETEKLSIL